MSSKIMPPENDSPKPPAAFPKPAPHGLQRPKPEIVLENEKIRLGILSADLIIKAKDDLPPPTTAPPSPKKQ